MDADGKAPRGEKRVRRRKMRTEQGDTAAFDDVEMQEAEVRACQCEPVGSIPHTEISFTHVHTEWNVNHRYLNVSDLFRSVQEDSPQPIGGPDLRAVLRGSTEAAGSVDMGPVHLG